MNDNIKLNILGDNIASVELVDSMGSDLTIVNSARVSFGKRKDVLDLSDINLIKFLAKNKHFSPFRHVQFQFHIKAPEIVARQLYKHVVGITATSDSHTIDHAWNEISGRYVIYDEEFYIPRMLRKQSKDNKQASIGEPVEAQNMALESYKFIVSESYKYYKTLLDMGVCREQARGVLPVSFYTEWYWSASLQAVCNLINLRDSSHAQWESQQFAIAIKELIEPIVPIAYKALME